MNKQQVKRVSMSGENLKRLRVIQDYISKNITRSEAAEKLDISEKQVTRLKKKILGGNEQNIIHSLTGKPSNNKIADEVKASILNLYKSKYEPCGFNFTHLTEKLVEAEGLDISRETLGMSQE